jgi:hypothetical protein
MTGQQGAPDGAVPDTSVGSTVRVPQRRAYGPLQNALGTVLRRFESGGHVILEVETECGQLTQVHEDAVVSAEAADNAP